jgi:hypothetical protein
MNLSSFTNPTGDANPTWEAGEHVCYLTSDQHVHKLYYSYNNQNWLDRDLTGNAIHDPEEVAVPLAAEATDLSSFALPGVPGEYVCYLGTDQHVHQLYNSGSNWHDQDLTLDFSGPLAAGNAVTSFLDGYGYHICYLTSDQHVHQLYSGDGANWVDQDLTGNAIPNPPETAVPLAAAGTALSSFADQTGEHVCYLGADQHVHQLYYPGGTWQDQDLTLEADGPLAAGNAISGFADFEISGLTPAAGEHVCYLTSDQHVHQLYYDFNNSQGWIDQDLTKIAIHDPPETAAVPLAAAGSALSGFEDAVDHICYLGADQHVHQIFNPGGTWHDQDLTEMASGPLVAGNAITGFADDIPGGGDHVCYLTSDQHVHQLYSTDAANWVDQDLTVTAIDTVTNINQQLQGAGVVVAFQDNVGDLWVVGPEEDSPGNLNLLMMPGTSPSIAALPSGGGYLVAFQDNTGNLWVVGTDGADGPGNTNQSMMPGTSPSICTLTQLDGSYYGYAVAFQDPTGDLVVAGAEPMSSPDMMQGTSPSIAANAPSSYVVAFQNNQGSLTVLGGQTPGPTNLGMMSGTSPSICSMENATYWWVAFQANTGDLYIAAGANNNFTPFNMHLSMMQDTSPTICPVAVDEAQVAFQAANTSALSITTSSGSSRIMSPGMMPGTSPSAVAPSIGGYVVAFEYNTGT